MTRRRFNDGLLNTYVVVTFHLKNSSGLSDRRKIERPESELKFVHGYKRVQNCTVSRPIVIAIYPDEKKRAHAQTAILGRLSYLWCLCSEAL
jgi:hypothetical protein